MYAAVLAPPLISLTCTISRSGYLQTGSTRKSIRAQRHSRYNEQRPEDVANNRFHTYPICRGRIDALYVRSHWCQPWSACCCSVASSSIVSRFYRQNLAYLCARFPPVLYIFMFSVFWFFAFWKEFFCIFELIRCLKITLTFIVYAFL
jgi:hypothetical protein